MLCVICKNPGKYTCPTCHVKYCSVDCSKQHKLKGHFNPDELSQETIEQLAQPGLQFKSQCTQIIESQDPIMEAYRIAKSNEDFASYLKVLHLKLK